MKLWEISDQIERVITDAIDRETGELDEAALESLSELQGDLKAKATQVALYIAGEIAEGKAVEEHAKMLAKRASGHKRRAEKLKSYLERHLLHHLGAEDISDPRVQIKWRTSRAVEIEEGAVLPDELTRVTVAPDKKAITERIKAGEKVKGCSLVERRNMSIS